MYSLLNIRKGVHAVINGTPFIDSGINEGPRKRSPSPGPRTEALVQNFTQLGSNKSKAGLLEGDLKDVRPKSSWRRSLPDYTTFSTDNKENSTQINFCR